MCEREREREVQRDKHTPHTATALRKMEAANLQIYWHESQPVYSLTFPPRSQYDPQLPKLFTAGGDNKIRIWNLNTVTSPTNAQCSKIDTIDFLASLQQHEQAINVIRFNSTGTILASAGDDGQILLWKRNKNGASKNNNNNVPFGSTVEEPTTQDNNNGDSNESWFVWKRLRFHSHASEIYDLTWSPCDKYILCGCMDNFIRIFHITNESDDDESEPKCIISLKEHNHYVQGVTWDPQNKYILSQSTDRSINIYKLLFNTNGLLIDVLLQNKIIKFEKSYMFHNETLPSFFRRLTISPCGNLIMVPTGLSKIANNATTNNPDNNNNNNNNNTNDVTSCVYIFARSTLNDSFNKPIIKLPNLKKPALIISFNPIFYKSNSSNFIRLPYKLIFAIATSNEILIYDTENIEPLAIIGNLHYTPMTDLAWSPRGEMLMISSTDGFCSYISVDTTLFGTMLTDDEVSALKQKKIDLPSSESTSKLEKSNTTSPKKDIINILPVKKVEKNTTTTTTTIKSSQNIIPKQDIVNILPVKKKIKSKRTLNESEPNSTIITTPTMAASLSDMVSNSESVVKRAKHSDDSSKPDLINKESS